MMRSQVLTAALALLPACLTDPGDLGVAGGSGTDGASGSGASAEDSTDGSVDPSGLSTSGSTSDGDDDAGDSSTGTDEPEGACGVAPGLERRMTSLQFARTVEDVFGVSPTSRPGDGSSGVIPTAEGTSPDDQAALDAAGEEVAAAFDAAQAVSCDLDVTGAAATACTQTFISEVASAAMRGEHDAAALLSLAEAQPSFEAGIRAVVQAVVSSEALVDVTPRGDETDGVLQLDGPSMALRLSLFLWNSVPDLELRLAGDDDSILEPAVLQQQVARMMNDGRYIRTQGDFFEVLLQTRDLPSVSRQEAVDGWSVSLAEAMQEEQRRFIATQFAQPGTTLRDLLTTPQTILNDELAPLYADDIEGAPPATGAWEVVSLDPSRRAGLLTQLGFLAANATDTASYVPPAVRGAAVASGLLCVSIPAHPPGIPAAPPPSEDPRGDWEDIVSSKDSCASCHTLTDPPGFAFGAYDAGGQWDPSHPDLSSDDSLLDVAIEDAVDLSATLADHDLVTACVPRRYYEFAVRRELGDEDDCVIDALTLEFRGNDGDLSQLVESVALSDAFQLARPL